MGDETEHWKDLMSSKSQTRWHQLVVRQFPKEVTTERQSTSKQVTPVEHGELTEQ